MVASRRGAGAGAVTAPAVADNLVPRSEIAQQLDVTEQYLASWELAGEGPPAICNGCRVFYGAEAVRAWLLDQERRPNTNP